MTIDEFLMEMKKRIKNKGLDFIPVEKNRKTRQKYALSIIDIEHYLLELEKSDLFKGPELDRDRTNEYLWIFKKYIIDNIFYIKLKLREINNKQVVCISFHEDEFN